MIPGNTLSHSRSNSLLQREIPLNKTDQKTISTKDVNEDKSLYKRQLQSPVPPAEGKPARIIGGQEVVPYSVKYQASLQYKGRHYCGGTEHNLNKVEGFEQVFNVSQIHLHGFNYRTFDNDIMLLKLSRQAVLNSYVQQAVLGDPSDPPSGSSCTVSGWGVTQIYSYSLSPVLRSVDVQMINYCRYYYWGRISNNMLCAGPLRREGLLP
ncbi:hypothetical protein F7725_001437, partial [Dissostichus mawsoni]